MLPILTDELLIDAYRSALRLRLEREFVYMLRAEIRRRNLSVPGERIC
ncbi:sporulation histidine kinase inhibitor Sda [Cohnella sp. GCM10027633]